MKPVNLLPPRYRPARATGERPGIGYAAIGALAVLLLMVVMYVLTNNKINDATAAAAQAQVERDAAQARAGQLSSFGDFAQLKGAREAAVASIAEVRFDWERLMREVALVLPKGVFLVTFTGSASGDGSDGSTGPLLTLGGCAPNHPAVAATLVRLRKMHNVTSADLSNSTKATTASNATTAPCPTSWSGTVKFQAETPPTTPAPVPARLGGGQ